MKEHRYFRIKNIQIVTAIELIESPTQVKSQRLLLTCASIYELPSNIRTLKNGITSGALAPANRQDREVRGMLRTKSSLQILDKHLHYLYTTLFQTSPHLIERAFSTDEISVSNHVTKPCQ